MAFQIDIFLKRNVDIRRGINIDVLFQARRHSVETGLLLNTIDKFARTNLKEILSFLVLIDGIDLSERELEMLLCRLDNNE